MRLGREGTQDGKARVTFIASAGAASFIQIHATLGAQPLAIRHAQRLDRHAQHEFLPAQRRNIDFRRTVFGQAHDGNIAFSDAHAHIDQHIFNKFFVIFYFNGSGQEFKGVKLMIDANFGLFGAAIARNRDHAGQVPPDKAAIQLRLQKELAAQRRTNPHGQPEFLHRFCPQALIVQRERLSHSGYACEWKPYFKHQSLLEYLRTAKNAGIEPGKRYFYRPALPLSIKASALKKTCSFLLKKARKNTCIFFLTGIDTTFPRYKISQALRVLLPRFDYMEDIMSKECDFCGKKPQVGNHVSHSNIKTKRRFCPNLQKVRHQFASGDVRTLTVCTRCLRSGAVCKPLVTAAQA